MTTARFALGVCLALGVVAATSAASAGYRVYVSNQGSSDISVFDENHVFQYAMSQPLLSIPLMLQRAPNGHSYSASLGTNTIVDFGTDDSYVTSLGNVPAICGLAVGGDNRIYGGGFDGANVGRIYTPDGTQVGSFVGGKTALVVTSSGYLVGVDNHNSSIDVMTLDGVAVRRWFTGGAPRGIAEGPDGYLYVARDIPADILVFDIQGSLIRTITSSSLRGPYGLAFSPRGTLYVANFDAGNVLEMDHVSGAVLSTISGPFNGPVDVTFRELCTDSDGDGYFYEAGCGTAQDCNDNLASAHPGAAQACDGSDNNCDGGIDGPCVHVDCVNGSDSNDGQTAATALRTLNEAMDRIHYGTGSGPVVVAAGVCPSEGGIRLPLSVEIVGAGTDLTEVSDTLYSNSCWDQANGDCPCEECNRTVKIYRLTVGSIDWDDEAPWPRFGCHNVYIRESRCRGLVRVRGDCSTLDTSDSTLGSVDALVGEARGPLVKIARSQVVGMLRVNSNDNDSISLTDSVFANVSVNFWSELQVHRSRFRGGSGTALRFRSGNGPVEISDSVFDGYTTQIDVEQAVGDVLIERNTFVRTGSAIVFRADAGWNNGLVSGNAFSDVAQIAIDDIGESGITADRNNFENVGTPACVGGVCYSTVADLNASEVAAGNLGVPSMFVDAAAGDYRLQGSSLLIDAGFSSPTTGVADADRLARPIDGNRDNLSVHDIGAFEFTDADGDSLDNRVDNCPLAYNADQFDTDGDGSGNACDNCITVPNADQADPDADQRGSACDNCPLSANSFQDDFDGDRVGNVCDNCILDWNTTQTDFDHDNQGDICDLNDGLIYVYSTDRDYREWQAELGYATWNSYRGSLAVLRATGQYTQAPGSNPLTAHNCGVSDAYVFDPLVPAPGEAAFNLVTGMVSGVESSLGTNSAGVPRANANPCP